ncbi:hypothetical protein AAC387_Pa12g0916 [Persea americana]
MQESKPAVTMQKKLVENRRPRQPEPAEPVPDITDLMNDWFFGSTNTERRAYNLTGGGLEREEEEVGRNNNSKLTQEWLEEAKRIVAMSPSRNDSPTRLVGSPRFAAVKHSDSPAALDRRDPLSRSARRHRPLESFSGEILSKTATKHNRNRSETFETPESDQSPAAAVHQWFSNILNPKQHQNPSSVQQDRDHDLSPTGGMRPPRQAAPSRRSRFQKDAADSPTAGLPIMSRRMFREPAAEAESQVLSPPKNLLESSHRRSISSSTCSKEKLSRSNGGDVAGVGPGMKEGEIGPLNSFLREQRVRIERISRGEMSGKAKIILSGSDYNSYGTSSMVAAICHAWLLENINKAKKKKEEEEEEEEERWNGVVVPVMNLKRRRMWKQKQAAWLFHHLGIDACALLFSDEVDLENLIVSRQLSILVVGQDVLKTNGEVGSECTVLTDNYCEDAYDLLRTSYLKRLLLAGILLDTENLSTAAKYSTNRDAEAVQLLLVGSSSSHRHVFYEQLIQDQRDNSFLEAVQQNYGKLPTTGDGENGFLLEHRVSVRKSVSNTQQETNRRTSDTSPSNMKPIKAKEVSPKSAKQSQPQATPPKQATEPSRGKNKFFLAKWFGFGSK